MRPPQRPTRKTDSEGEGPLSFDELQAEATPSDDLVRMMVTRAGPFTYGMMAAFGFAARAAMAVTTALDRALHATPPAGRVFLAVVALLALANLAVCYG